MNTTRTVNLTKVKEFQLVHFRDNVKQDNGQAVDREILILYALAEDGIIYEYTGGKWLGLPITKDTMKEVSTK